MNSYLQSNAVTSEGHGAATYANALASSAQAYTASTQLSSFERLSDRISKNRDQIRKKDRRKFSFLGLASEIFVFSPD